MSDLAIHVGSLGKRYRIGALRRPQTLRGRLSELRRAPGPYLRQMFTRASAKEWIWALRDISFDVEPGEILGIIGRNGAGKSTLLKILSRITEPTTGEAMVYGRVGSLLEVGTGFHPELTGRENVFLNGAILGMTRAEVGRKFDEIVAFAEVEKFIDTPVKRYSTGMYVRLAFAVAAHLETEVLLIDEVLSVGDAQFQEKCLGKVGAVAREGRTVLFVSHVMPMVQALCTRVIHIDGGGVVQDGSPAEAVESYLVGLSNEDETEIKNLEEWPRSAGRSVAILEAWTENDRGEKTSRFLMGESILIKLRYRLSDRLKNPGFGFGIESAEGRRIFSLNNYMTSREPVASLPAGICSCHVTDPRLLAGTYWVSLSLVEDQREWVDYIERALRFTVLPADVYGTGRIAEKTQGLTYVPGEIDVE